MKRSVSFTDARGESHNTAEAATVSDLVGLFTKLPRGTAFELAHLIFDKREDIERILQEHDEATQQE